MFGRKAQQQGSWIVDPKECMVRPGIIQRTWLGELARSLAQLGTPGREQRATWADGLESLHELDTVLEMTIRGSAGLFLTSTAWVGDVAQDESGSGQLAASLGGAGDSEGAMAFPPGFPEPPRDREELEIYCEEQGIRSINWLVAGLDAPEGELVPGEENDDVLARLALRSLSSVTVTYAYGTFEKDMVIDALCGADVRERLDKLTLRLLDLPGLAWWSESFDPANYAYHWPADENRVSIAPAGSPMADEVIREAGSGHSFTRARKVRTEVKTLDKEFRDLPRIDGHAGHPSLQMQGRHPTSSRTTEPEWISATEAELKVGMAETESSGVLSGTGQTFVDVIKERYIQERARLDSARCAGQILGSDAGDAPLCAYIRQPLGREDYRVLTIHGIRDWIELVGRYPMVLLPTSGSATPELWGGNAHGVWVTVDWERASQEYDGIHLSVLGALDAAYVPVRVGIPGSRGVRECWTMMAEWEPGSVVWLNDPMNSWPADPVWSFDDVQREYEEALALLTGELNDGD